MKRLVKMLVGSRMYGTYRPDSDYDIRGVEVDPPLSLIGLAPPFRERSESTGDEKYFGLKHFVNLAFGCNPNILEMLFCNEFIETTPEWMLLYRNRLLFLDSKKLKSNFLGYLTSQAKECLRLNQNPKTEKNRERLEKYGYDTKMAANFYRIYWQYQKLCFAPEFFTPVLSEWQIETFNDVLNGKIGRSEFAVNYQMVLDSLDAIEVPPLQSDKGKIEGIVSSILMAELMNWNMQ